MGDHDQRRVYYDHEPTYRRIAAKGGRSWDDMKDVPDTDAFDSLREFLASRFAPPVGTRALEVGCGGGQATLELAKRGYVASGVDFAETAIELAKQNALAAQLKANFQVDDCLFLRTKQDGSFGLVIDNHAFHCIVSPDHRRAFLAQVARVLAPGGVFFTETMSCGEGWDAVIVRADPSTRVALNGGRFWVTEHEFDAELASAGFELVHRHTRAQPPKDVPAGPMLVRYVRRK